MAKEPRTSGDYPRFHLYLDRGDVEWFKEVFAEIGVSTAVRAVMRDYRQRIEAVAAQRAKGGVAKITPELLQSIGEEGGTK